MKMSNWGRFCLGHIDKHKETYINEIKKMIIEKKFAKERIFQ